MSPDYQIVEIEQVWMLADEDGYIPERERDTVRTFDAPMFRGKMISARHELGVVPPLLGVLAAVKTFNSSGCVFCFL